jgi:energy-coupling factor transporter ATP-binding protein EcfA2
MTTPSKSMILQKATELYFEDCYRHGCQNPNNPESNELAESGFIQAARSELMRSKSVNEEWKNYAELEDFVFDLNLALEQGVFVSGGRGCGKSSLTKTIVDRFLKEGYVIRVFDNSQTWRFSTVPNLAIIESHSNFEPQYNESYVLDTSLLSIEEQKAFIENIVDKEFAYTANLSENERTWRIYVFEECELLLGTHDQSKKLLKLCAVGRNLKMSYVVVAQRFQMLSVNMISLCGQLYLGMMHEQNDLKKAYNWLGDKTKELTKLDVGQFIRYSKGKSTKMNVDLFTTEMKPKLVIAEQKPIPQIEPISTTNDGRGLKALIMSTLLLLAICYGLSQMVM